MSEQQAATETAESAETTEQSAEDRPGYSPEVREAMAAYAQEQESEDGEDTSEEQNDQQTQTKPDPKKAAEPEQPEVTLDELKELAEKGEVAEALKRLGIKKPEKVAAKHWQDFRAKQQELAREKEEWVKQMTADKDEVAAIVSSAEKRFAKWEKAEQLWDEGDVAGATQAAFGVDPDSFAAKNIDHKLSRNPENEKLKARLDRIEKERAQELEDGKKAEEEAKQRQLKQQQAQAIEAEKDRLMAEVGELEAYQDWVTEDNGWFRDQVFHQMAVAVANEGEDITPEEAAERAIKQTEEGFKRMPKRRRVRILAMLNALENPDQPGPTAATPDQDGSTPARQGRTVPLQRAQVADEKPMSYAQLRRVTARNWRAMSS